MNDPANLSRRVLLGASATTTAAVLIGAGADPATAAAAADPAAGQRLLQAPETVQSVETGRYSAVITEFGTAYTVGDYADCAVVFTAPDTGRVLIHWSGAPRSLSDETSPVAYISPEVRVGGVVGAGTVVLIADNARTVRTNLTGPQQAVRAGAAHLLSGLTPGSVYNARLLHRVTSEIGEFFHRTLIVAPAT